jgi:regulator of RNase E activity RraB
MRDMALFRRKQRSEAVDFDERSPKTEINDGDQEVVNQLVQHGADMSQPRHVLYYLYFTSQEAATSAAADAMHRSFDTSVGEPQEQSAGQWSLTCERHGIVLDTDTIRNNSDYFDALAAKFSGDYDGWEASIR